MITRTYFILSVSTLLVSTNVFAKNCDQHCLEKLLAQITTLRAGIKSAVPVGTILPYSGSQAIPRGYVSCNGQLIDRASYSKLFETIGVSFTNAEELGSDQFRVPNLNGRTIVGTDTEKKLNLGDQVGSEFQQLSLANLPPHIHRGITEDNDKEHTHEGKTGHSNQDINHHHDLGGKDSGTGKRLMKGGDGCGDLHLTVSTSGPIGKDLNVHTHSFTTDNNSTKHTHPFITDDGSAQGLTGESFSVMQPSVGMRFMIKAE